MKVNSPVTVRLESAGKTRTFGPFDQLWFVDGMILSDLDQPHSHAELDDATNFWICSDDRKAWDRVILTEA